MALAPLRSFWIFGSDGAAKRRTQWQYVGFCPCSVSEESPITQRLILDTHSHVFSTGVLTSQRLGG